MVRRRAPGAGPGAPLTVRTLDPYGGDRATEGSPQTGGTLVIGNDREIISFDPTRQNSNLAATMVYDSLFKLMPDGTAQPYLAASMTSPDGGVTWRMGLRDGVRFSDGTPLDANAVIVNTQRHIDKAASPAHAFALRIMAMRAIDPLTVEFVLDGPMGDFPVVFAQPMSQGTLGMIVSPAALAQYGDDIASHPVGAGPFMLSNWVRDNKMELVRNPDYWQKGMPYLDGVEIRPLPDTESRYATMANGDVDAINGGFNTELVRAFANPDLRVYFGPGNGGVLNYFNFARAPFDDKRMREAAVAAMDPNALGAAFFSNQLIRAESLFDETSPYHTQQATDAWPKYDVARAKQLVDEYRASGGNPDFVYTTDRSSVPLGEFVQASMAAVGVKVEVRYFDLAEYAGRVLQGGDFDMASQIAAFDYPFPGISRVYTTGGSSNFGKYQNPQVDQLVLDASATQDAARRTSDYQQLELLLNQDVAVQWLSRSYLSTITKPQVKGIDRYITRDLFVAGTWIDRTQ
ncbi:ABC transporter substrate-binding protein [Pseudonocardia alaniniphila]|uniref:ABC transporter substrate-binding protein n=1 Tax=Pseudonocardia alaniniphila TaxID=75291 RepID=A0ABS9T721_9PSEU|nr:ABC transporter substrate-binding protein [Pseudonocardia alaniniphila]MCH6164329.1 ABC transporter substrate-binding protein [Pseudonocardia alaniniphila]